MESSAVVNVVVGEPGSDVTEVLLQTYRPHSSSLLTIIEATRALHRRIGQASFEPRLAEILRVLDLIPIDAAIAQSASRLDPPLLRSLDAIHLASALSLGPDLDGILTYDRRLADAAKQLGITVFP